jgi:hypothetical protein
MRFPRLTSRRLMIVVAIAGVILFAGQMWRRSVTFAELARENGVYKDNYMYIVYEYEQDENFKPEWKYTIGRFREMADGCGRREAKYLRAARYPWLSVEPDPPVLDEQTEPDEEQPSSDTPEL